MRGLANLALLMPALMPTLVWGCSSNSNSGGGLDAIIGSQLDGSATGLDAAVATQNDGSAPSMDVMFADGAPAQDGAPNLDGSVMMNADGSSSDDAGDLDAAALGPDTGPHPSPGVCFPDPTQTGNSMNIGAYCTQGGHECGQYHNGLTCAIDVDPMGGNFCIKIGFCQQASDCGEEACCTGRAGNPIHACVPKQCVAPDAGADCPPPPS
jgi:hypothetical protein